MTVADRNRDITSAVLNRMADIESTAMEIERNPSAETGYLLELATFFCDAPVYQDDDLGRVMKSFLTALLENRGKKMPKVIRCSRCGVPTNGCMWKPHSELCRHLDGTETELPDEAVRAAMKVLKRRSVESNNIVPFVRGGDAGDLSDEIPF